MIGALSGMLPVLQALVAALVFGTKQVERTLLAFAAGAMIFVVAVELVPGANAAAPTSQPSLSWSASPL